MKAKTPLLSCVAGSCCSQGNRKHPVVCDSGGGLFPLLKADKPAKNGQFALFQLPVDKFLFVSFQGLTFNVRNRLETGNGRNKRE